ncbi:MAG: hypothetical protein ABI654_11365 [Betaproteobacteria bacterium]
MMKAGTLARFAAGAFLCGSAGVAIAADITMIQPSASTVTLQGGQVTVRFAVSGSAASNDHCGYFVEYSDGMAGDSRVIDNENGGFSRPHERIFNRPGTYTVRASGRNVKTTGPCNGAATTTVTILAAAAPGPVSRRGAAPTCPEGWALNERTVNWRTGAFSCTAKPEVQLVCPDGLVYYERDGIIGCRLDRRDR